MIFLRESVTVCVTFCLSSIHTCWNSDNNNSNNDNNNDDNSSNNNENNNNDNNNMKKIKNNHINFNQARKIFTHKDKYIETYKQQQQQKKKNYKKKE